MKYFGAWSGRCESLGGMRVCEGPIRVLGLHFISGDSALVNWQRRVAMAKQKLAFVYPVPACLRARLTRAVFRFMWGSYEYVQRARMYQPVVEGGRNVPCFGLKFDVLFFSNLCVALAGPVRHDFQLFVRLWFSHTMRRLGEWHNTVPRAETMPGHYRHAALWARRHVECRDPALAVDHRKLYHALRVKLKPGELVGVAKEVWARVQAKGLGNRLCDLNWLVVLNRLPVRDTLYRHGISRSQVCPRNQCRGVETVGHAFWGCAFVQEVFDRASRRFPALQGLTQGGVLFGEGRQGGTGRERFMVLLVVSLIKKALWDSRCLAVRCSVEGKVEGVLGWVRNELGRLRADVERWGFHAANERWRIIWEVVQ